MTHAPAPLAVTMGEPAGIGGEIAVKAWRRRQALSLPAFFLIADADHISRAADAAGGASVVRIDKPAAATAAFAAGLPVLPIDLAVEPRFGQPDPANASAVLRAIELGVQLVRNGSAAGLVTNPIQKSVLDTAGFRHPGHTEYLAELCGGNLTPVMMLACPGLRTVPVTVHRPLAAAITELTAAGIVERAAIAEAALTNDFGIAAPRLAVAGLNPHAGEAGVLGREEIDIIEPAIAALRNKGIDVIGPMSADTMFHAKARESYDAAICMYHDQALIPLKTLDFERGVNITLGLPIVRTSPDHGTALTLAGSGQASEASLVAALQTAAEMAGRRSGVHV